MENNNETNRNAKKNAPEEKAGKRSKSDKLPLWVSGLMLTVTFIIIAVMTGIYLANIGQARLNIIGAVTAEFLGLGAFSLYVLLRKKELAENLRQMLLICVCLLAAISPLFATMGIDLGFAAYMLAILLMALMSNERVAIFASLPVAVTAGIIAASLDVSESAPFAMMLTRPVSSIVAVLTLNITKTRSSTVIASSLGGVVGVLCMAGVMLAGGELFYLYWESLLWVLGSFVVSGILAVGIMPVFESAFDIASDARLNELLNNNNPLLKRLMTETPGTYHHSLIVATLAEAAAEAIGANALMCRVCACYHDVGKLKDPLCFKENQHGKNIHDELDPYESARRIISHQKYGVQLLEKNKLPSEVIKIVSEHHGDSVMVYFYDKAKKQAAEGETIDVNKFRYPANKPSTKESAILLLSDCCEAAVRSMNNPSMKEIAQRVRDVINNKWDKRGSMLWNSPLTFVDIKKIEKSFFKTFAALYHERIEYPDLEDIDVR